MTQNILFIDDDESFQLFAAQACKKIPAVQTVFHASNGREGLDLLEELAKTHQSLPKIAFVDINMPYLDGFGFLTGFIHLKEQYSDLSYVKPVAMLTSSDETRDRDKAKILGADKYFVKTASLAELRNVISGCIHENNI